MATLMLSMFRVGYIVASELKDPICHSDECQIGSFSSVAAIYTYVQSGLYDPFITKLRCYKVIYFALIIPLKSIPANSKHLYNMHTMLHQR